MDKEIMVIKRSIAPVVSEARKLTIKSDKEMQHATELLSRLNKIKDKITEEKEKVTVPLNEALKAERNRWKPIEQEYSGAIEHVREMMGEYQTENVRLAKIEEEKIAARIGPGKGKISIHTAMEKFDRIEKPAGKIITASGSARFSTVKVLKITDEKKIPRKYYDLNESRLLADLKAGVIVPGAEVEEKQNVINSR